MTGNTEKHPDELLLKDIIVKFNVWVAHIKTKWIIILFCGIIGGIAGFAYAKYKKPIYIAKLSFVLEEGKGSSPGLGGLASLAGQFGVDVGGGSGEGLLSGDNILLFFKSTSLAREVLLSEYDHKSKTSIADEYAKVYGLSEDWSKNEKVGLIDFPILNKNIKYSRLQDSLISEIVSSIISKQFSVARTDKKAGFIEVTCTMQSELLAKAYCERIVQKGVNRYIDIKTQRQSVTVQKLQVRVDSISNLLRKKTFSGASLQNSSNTMDINPLYKTNTSVEVETTLRDKTLLSTIFASVTQNLELAKFTLSQETPVIQVVDSPYLPLKTEKISRLGAAIMGFFTSALFTVFWLIYKKK